MRIALPSLWISFVYTGLIIMPDCQDNGGYLVASTAVSLS
jgi:hypothetical protein